MHFYIYSFFLINLSKTALPLSGNTKNHATNTASRNKTGANMNDILKNSKK